MRNTSISRLPLYALSGLLLAATAWAYVARIDIAVRTRGVVRPEGDALQIVSETSGRIVRVHAKEGDVVQAGRVMLQLDDRDLRLGERLLVEQIHKNELQLADLERRLNDAAALDEIAAEVDMAEEDAAVRSVLLKLENARERHRRAERLFEAGLASRQFLDDARFDLDTAEAERDRPSSQELKREQARNRLGSLAAERAPIELALSAAYHDLEKSRLEITRRDIVSPVNGRITSMPRFKAGEFLNSGALAASIMPAAQSLVVEAWLAASERGLVVEGQTVRMQFESVPNSLNGAIDGVVTSIAPDVVFSQSGSGGYRVIVHPTQMDSDLLLGMTLQVHFITRRERLLWLFFDKMERELNNDIVHK